MIWSWVFLCLLLNAAVAVGCSGRRFEYDQGTLRFDWRKQKPASAQRREKFERQYARNTELLKVKLQDEVIIQAVRRSNSDHRGMTQAEIERLDRQWQESGNEIMSQLTDEKCSNLLKAFQNAFSGFAEIFVADAYGLNVCQTNKTSDYYQADEEWWEHAFKKGEVYRAQLLEFDDSAEVFAVPVHLPIQDPATGNIIGAAKAIVMEDRSAP